MKNKYTIKGQTVEIHYKRQRDGLKFSALIDRADFDLVKDATQGYWYVGFFGHKKSPYMIGTTHRVYNQKRKEWRNENILMHRLIMGKPKKKVVDHIRGNDSTLDNRRSNLQVITHRNNVLKQKINIKPTSRTGKYKHINREKVTGSYAVGVKSTYYGTFDTIAEAIVQRDMAIAWHNWHSIGRLIGEPEPMRPAVPNRCLSESERRQRNIANVRAYRLTAKGKASIKRSYLRWKARGYKRVGEVLQAA